MKKATIKVIVDIDTESILATKEQITDWLSYEFAGICGLSKDNPLFNIEPTIVSVKVEQ